jgi:hypothetical protein
MIEAKEVPDEMAKEAKTDDRRGAGGFQGADRGQLALRPIALRGKREILVALGDESRRGAINL